MSSTSLFPKKRSRSSGPVEMVVASTGFPVSNKRPRSASARSNSKNEKVPTEPTDSLPSQPNKKYKAATKLLDWHETAREVRQLGATAFQGQQKRHYQDEEYKRLTGRERRKQPIPLHNLRNRPKKLAKQRAAAEAEAKALGVQHVVAPTLPPKKEKKKSNSSRMHGPAPSIGFVKKGVLQLKRKPV